MKLETLFNDVLFKGKIKKNSQEELNIVKDLNYLNQYDFKSHTRNLSYQVRSS